MYFSYLLLLLSLVLLYSASEQGTWFWRFKNLFDISHTFHQREILLNYINYYSMAFYGQFVGHCDPTHVVKVICDPTHVVKVIYL